MSPDQFQVQFAADTEFRKLLARQPDVDLLTAALELARDGYAGLQFMETHRWIADRVAELQPQTLRAESVDDAMHALADCLAKRYGLNGDPACHQVADGSYLNRVITTGRGIPISLSLVYIAVGRQLGLPVFGIAAPAHFLVGCDSPDGVLILDAYSAGRIFNRKAAVDWLAELTGWPPDAIDETLCPATERAVILRMLNNLKRVHIQDQNWTAALQVQLRLSALQPAVFEERRDLAVIALNAGRTGLALTGIERCLSTCPPDERKDLLQHWQAAKSKIAASN